MKATTMRAARRRPGAPQDERNEIARREAVKQSGLLVSERSPRISRFVADLAGSIGKPLSCLTVLDSTTQHAQFGSRELLGAAPLDQSICRHLVFSTDETLLVPDLRDDPRFSHLASVTRPNGVRFYAGSVVRSLDGHRLGSLCVMDHEPGNLAPAQLHALLDATAALERLVEEHRHEQADLREILADIGGRAPTAPLPLALQPIVATRTMRPVGAEALLRWRRPDGTVVRPDLLIPRLEATGLLFAVDRAVLRTACRKAAGFPAELGISVNISSSWFQPGVDTLPHAVETALTHSGLAPERLTIEITEQVMISDPRTAARTCVTLKGLGVKLALDDFGTGYSSLSHLAAYPFDVIKLHRSFLQMVGRSDKADKLVGGVIKLGRGIGLQVCVEGVETESELAFLRTQDCDLVQGFLIDALVQNLPPSLASDPVA